MSKVARAMIGTVVLIGVVRVLGNAIKGVGVFDVFGSTAVSVGIALWICYFIKNRWRQ